MLWDRCPVCPTVTLVYGGQMGGWITMPLGMEVGLGPGDVVSAKSLGTVSEMTYFVSSGT